MKLYILQTTSIDEFLRLAASQSELDEDKFDTAVQPVTTKILTSADRSNLLEAYVGILDDHDIEVGGDANTIALDEVTEGTCAWMSFAGANAQKIVHQLGELKISNEDAENYFGESDEELIHELKALHREFAEALQQVHSDETAFLRAEM